MQDSKGTMSLWWVWAKPIIDSSQSDTFFDSLMQAFRRNGLHFFLHIMVSIAESELGSAPMPKGFSITGKGYRMSFHFNQNRQIGTKPFLKQWNLRNMSLCVGIKTTKL